MKTTIQLAIFVLLLGAWRLSFATEWELSVTGGSARANNPFSDDVTAEIDMDTNSVMYLILNHFERNDDDARISSEFLLANNTISAMVSEEGELPYKAEIDAYHLQAGGTYEWAGHNIVRPYFVMTGGLSHYMPKNTSDETYFSGTLGLGLKVKLAENIALRAEARALGSLLDQSSSIFCGSNSGCAISLQGSVWVQQHVTAGATWSF